jgi:hypothetical protein
MRKRNDLIEDFINKGEIWRYLEWGGKIRYHQAYPGKRPSQYKRCSTISELKLLELYNQGFTSMREIPDEYWSRD